ncbi:hypothetical protein TWF506_004796 [Arthrobotrys conoides]|uniref:Uncharacterized protein n=1 Tax=Arthrobotrys conoides TaxID=74498 RepID=A0AAN8MWK4_9PEZI
MISLRQVLHILCACASLVKATANHDQIVIPDSEDSNTKDAPPGTLEYATILADVPAGGVWCDHATFTQAQVATALTVAYQCLHGTRGAGCNCISGSGKHYPSDYNNTAGWFPPGLATMEIPLGTTGYCTGDPGKYRVIYDVYDGTYVGTLYHRDDDNRAFSCCYNFNAQMVGTCACNKIGGFCP